MKRFLVIVLVLVAIMVAAYFIKQEQHENDHELVLYGNVDVRQVDLGFRVLGRVNEMFFEEGDLVLAGALVGRLDKNPYNEQISQAEATVRSTQASLVNAQILFDRRNALVGDGSVSQEDYDTALANVNILTADLHNSTAALEVAKSNLFFTEVYAPTDGTILSRVREPGTVVNPGEAIYTLSVLNPVWVRAYVSEPQLGLVYPGMTATIHTDTKGGKVYTGHVGFISPVAEFTPKTVETTQLRTDLVYRLRIYAEDPDLGLRQGMPVTVRLPLTPPQNPVEPPRVQ